MNKILRKSYVSLVVAMAAISMVNTSCSDTESYAELLADETKSVNYFLAIHHVINEITEDSIFETGEDAPYYRMDDEGNIYMQVLKTGDTNNKATTDQRIYFRFMRYNLNTYASYGTMPDGDGNADDMSSSATYFVFNNYNFPSSTSYGSGLQTPLYYLGIDCEVNIVIKSQYGLSSEISYVEPYLYNIRYFKSMI